MGRGGGTGAGAGHRADLGSLCLEERDGETQEPGKSMPSCH